MAPLPLTLPLLLPFPAVEWAWDAAQLPAGDAQETRPHVCIEVLEAQLSSTEPGTPTKVLQNTRLIVPLQCHQGPASEPTAAQALQLHGLQGGKSYQIFFYLRRTALTHAHSLAHGASAGGLQLLESRVLVVAELWPSRFPVPHVGTQMNVVVPPGKGSATIEMFYELYTNHQSRNFPVQRLTNTSHFDICCTVQVQEPAVRTLTGLAVKAPPGTEPTFQDVTTFCVYPGPGPKTSLTLNGVKPQPDGLIYRVLLYTKLSELGHAEVPWPAHLPRLGTVGSAESRGEERSEDQIFPLVVKTFEDWAPRLVRHQAVLELHADKPLDIVVPGTEHFAKEERLTADGEMPIGFTGNAPLQVYELLHKCMHVLMLEGGAYNYSIAQKYGAENVQQVIDDAELYNATNALRPLSDGFLPYEARAKQPKLFRAENVELALVACDRAVDDKGSMKKSLISRMPPGIYKVQFTLGFNITTAFPEAMAHLTEEEKTDFGGKATFRALDRPGATTEVVVVVQRGEEVQPSYKWMDLRGWHTVPPGTQTRLPLSSVAFDEKTDIDRPWESASLGSVRQCVVPDPFQLQLRMPRPCRYFFRTNVHPGTTLQELQEEARKLCALRLPPQCLLLQREEDGAAAESLDLSLTSEQANLFNLRLALAVDLQQPECKAAKSAQEKDFHQANAKTQPQPQRAARPTLPTGGGELPSTLAAEAVRIKTRRASSAPNVAGDIEVIEGE